MMDGLRKLRRAFGIKRSAGKPPQLKMLLRHTETDGVFPAHVPPSYRLLPAQAAHHPDWIDLLNQTEEFGAWTADRLEREIVRCLVPEGGFLACTLDGQIIGCASLCQIPEYLPYSVLNYVAVLGEHRGKGLGRALTAQAINRSSEEGFPGILLHTDDFRIPAIRLYLELGFEPIIDPSNGSKRRWKRILESRRTGSGHSR